MFLSFKINVLKNAALLLVVTSAFLIPIFTQAAQVQVQPATGTYGLGQIFDVSLEVSPDGSTANAVEMTLEFDPSILSVVSISKDRSIFSRWTNEPTYSNSLGTIKFGGVSAGPFFDASNLVDVTFRTLAPGNGDLSVAQAAVYATDGLRTDVFTASSPAVFTVNSSLLPVEQSETSESATDEMVDTFGLMSQQFFDAKVWFSINSGTFNWDLPAGVEAVAVEVAATSNNRPNNNAEAIYETPITELVVTSDMLIEGVQYLSLRFRDEDGWGDVLNRPILIDTVAPEAFQIEINSNNNNNFPRLDFEAVDFTSGIVGYEIMIANQDSIMLSKEEVKYGYQLSNLTDGNYDVKITAFDAAGNSRLSEVTVNVHSGWSPSAVKQQPLTNSILDYIPNLYVYVLSLIVLLLLIHIHFERKKILLKEVKLVKETKEIQNQTEKIFSALRDEIYDQINTINSKKRLSKAEKEAVAGLNQAISVSETLIEKEINDVKSILK